MCLIYSLKYETKLHVKLLLLSSSCKAVVIGVEQKWNERSGTALIKHQARLRDPETQSLPPSRNSKVLTISSFFYTKNVSLKYVKYNLIILKWWLQPLSLASTLVVFFYKMLFKIIYGTSYLFKNALSDWSHNFYGHCENDGLDLYDMYTNKQ